MSSRSTSVPHGLAPAVLGLGLTVVFGVSAAANDVPVLANADFDLKFATGGGVIELHNPQDGTLNYVLGSKDHPRLNVQDSRWLGDLVLRYRFGMSAWRLATTGQSSDSRRIERSVAGNEVAVHYSGASHNAGGIRGLALVETWRLTEHALIWAISIRNVSGITVRLGDLALPLPFNTYYVKDRRTTYEERVIRHSYIAGDNSYILLVRVNGVGPFLLMTPSAGTRLEYFDRCTAGSRANADASVFGEAVEENSHWEGLYTAYIHAAVQVSQIEPRGSWNLPVTSRDLKPGEQATYSFKFQWVEDYAAARRALINDGLLELQAAPGMVIPEDLSAMISVASKGAVESIEAQYPAQTRIERFESGDPTRQNWRFTFHRLGENKIEIRWDGGRATQLEYFVIEPLDKLIKKRASFIAHHQQVRDIRKWYDGLFSLWDMRAERLRTPEDPGGLYTFEVSGSDDPDLSKAPYIASKNIVYPDAEEIASVEYYLEHFVWGKLQRTDHESPFPYGIYGSDSWHANRFSEVSYGSGGLGQEHMWRSFDYTHLIQLYYQMYRMARLYPELVHYLDATGYLERAYGTAMAFFEVPYQIRMGKEWDFHGWTDWAYKQGAFHELYIPPLIDALLAAGRAGDAARLRAQWEKKAKYFAYDEPYPFGSEMYFDTTAFQSVHALARYGIEHELKPDTNLWQDKNSGIIYSHSSVRREDFARLMERGLVANIAARGYLETNYYQLGSDYRQSGNSSDLLSYMTQMGGAPILDYALNFARGDASTLARLGYASYLGSWALVNAGAPESGYGYWYKGEKDDGAASWNFSPQKYSPSGVVAKHGQPRGGVPVDGEIDNGFSDALLGASTVVIDDPLFGLIALGGEVRRSDGVMHITSHDGVGERLIVRTADLHVDILLDRDGFDTAEPIRIYDRAARIEFSLESRYPRSHVTTLTVQGALEGGYQALAEGRVQQVDVEDMHKRLTVPLQIDNPGTRIVLQSVDGSKR